MQGLVRRGAVSVSSLTDSIKLSLLFSYIVGSLFSMDPFFVSDYLEVVIAVWLVKLLPLHYNVDSFFIYWSFGNIGV